jgi:hypothetical protein
VSDNFFNIFPCHFIDGIAKQLFADKNNIIISNVLALIIMRMENNPGDE